MTDFQRCHQAATVSLCLEKAAALPPPPRHLELIRTAAEAYRRVLDACAIGPEWTPAHRARLDTAENLAIATIKHTDQLEARHG